MNQYLRRKIWTLNRSGKFRGYLRTVSGYPVTLTDCMTGQPVSLAVDGDAVQDGTPTPDNPVDVQLCGDRILPLGYTAVEYIEGTGTQWIDTDIGSDENTGMYLEAALTEVLQYPPENGGKNFLGVISSNFLIGYQNNNDSQDFRFSRKKGIGVTLEYDFDTPLDTNKHTFQNNYLNNHKFVVDEESVDAPDAEFKNTRGMAIFRTTFGNTGYYNAPIKAKIYRLKISQDTDIIADVYPAKRDSDGVVGMYDIISNTFFTNSGTGSFIAGDGLTPVYRVTGNVRGLNLLSSAWEDGNIDINTGNCDESGMRIRTADYIKCKPNTVYTFYTPYSVIGVRGYDADKTYVSFFPSTVTSSTLTFTTRKNVEYLKFITESSDGTRPDKTLPYMLVQGSYTAETMPPYEPYQPPQEFAVYLPEQIAKVGDVADEVVVDMENRTAELKKNVGSMVVSDGYSGATSAANTLLARFYHVTKPARKVSANANVIDIAADIFEAETFNNLGSAFTSKQYAISGNVNTSIFNVTVPKTAIGGDTNELMNAWAAEHPATVYYVLAEPVTTDITSLQQWDAMPSLWSGTAVITADTVIAPSAITAKYYASKPEEVN